MQLQKNISNGNAVVSKRKHQIEYLPENHVKTLLFFQVKCLCSTIQKEQPEVRQPFLFLYNQLIIHFPYFFLPLFFRA